MSSTGVGAVMDSPKSTTAVARKHAATFQRGRLLETVDQGASRAARLSWGNDPAPQVLCQRLLPVLSAGSELRWASEPAQLLNQLTYQLIGV